MKKRLQQRMEWKRIGMSLHPRPLRLKPHPVTFIPLYSRFTSTDIITSRCFISVLMQMVFVWMLLMWTALWKSVYMCEVEWTQSLSMYHEIHFLISPNLLRAQLTGTTVPVHKEHGGAPHSCSTWGLIADGGENSSSQTTELSFRSEDKYWLSLFRGLGQHCIAKKNRLVKGIFRCKFKLSWISVVAWTQFTTLLLQLPLVGKPNASITECS